MSKRKIIKIDEAKCTGCGDCIPNCPEGALQIIDGKARLISDLFCDGLGACIGYCPEGTILIEEREAQQYDEKKVMENIVKQGKNVIKAHLMHLKDHGEDGLLKEAREVLKERGIKDPTEGCDDHGHGHSECPGSRVMDFKTDKKAQNTKGPIKGMPSELRQWPVQIMLVPSSSPYLKNGDVLLAADCVPFAYADFHQELLKDKVLLVGCPKLDDADFYKEKITQILKTNDIKSVTCARMEVPCCFGLVHIMKSAIKDSGKNIPLKEVIIGIKGGRLK